MLTGSLILLCLFLVYKVRREKELFAESIDSYSTLVSELNFKLQQQQQLAADLAHDLKGPLASIVASADSLQFIGTCGVDQYAECLKLMRDSGRTNLRLVSNFIEFVADRNKKVLTQKLPDNRSDLLRGLLPADYLENNRISWSPKVHCVEVNLALRPFISAFAELCDLAVREADKTNSSALIQEEIITDSGQQLLLSLSPMPVSFPVEVKAHYMLAVKILERLGLKIIEGSCSEQRGFIEIYLPVEKFSVTEIQTSHNNKLAEAELLVSWSAQQVHSAKLSVDSLQNLAETEDSRSESEQITA